MKSLLLTITICTFVLTARCAVSNSTSSIVLDKVIIDNFKFIMEIKFILIFRVMQQIT
jgi:hypothetical protein